jgi:hypothetical protein
MIAYEHFICEIIKALDGPRRAPGYLISESKGFCIKAKSE